MAKPDKKQQDHETIEELFAILVKKATSVKAIVLLGITAIAVGVTLNQLWGTKADAKDVDALEKRTTTLEIHHAADDVRMDNVAKSGEWTQEAVWKMAQAQGVKDLPAPPAKILVQVPSTPTPQPTK